MTISGMRINPFDYGNTQIERNPAKELNTAHKEQNTELLPQQDEQPVKVRAPKILTDGQLEDFAFDFKKNKEFSMTGDESDLTSLDLAGKIPDNRKDELLDQYRFFVEEENSPIRYQSPDGMVKRVIR